MAQQKLYTEEQVREVLSNMLLTTEQVESIFEELTPIELPSDEDIEKAANSQSHYEGAMWLKYKILNQNK
jgi:hypothetical protein